MVRGSRDRRTGGPLEVGCNRRCGVGVYSTISTSTATSTCPGSRWSWTRKSYTFWGGSTPNSVLPRNSPSSTGFAWNYEDVETKGRD